MTPTIEVQLATDGDDAVKAIADDVKTNGNSMAISFFIFLLLSGLDPGLLTGSFHRLALNAAYTPTVRARAVTENGTAVTLR